MSASPPQVASVPRRLLLSAAVGVLCGLASALFLWLLDHATTTRMAHPQLVFGLPVAGVLLGWVLERVGRPVAGGSSLLIERVRDGGPTVALRMAPLVLLGTVITHLFGGSAGREGTAVQMGGSLADNLASYARVDDDTRRLLMLAGVAGGFGSVFGTPLSGVVFAIEILVVSELRGNVIEGFKRVLRALLPASIAALVADGVTRALGIEHTAFSRVASPAWSWSLITCWLALAVAVALTVIVFIELTQRIKQHSTRLWPRSSWRMGVGGVVVVLLWLAVGSDDYVGLGVATILRAFDDPSLPQHAFALKLLFTALTLGVGFVGGEVTPLFFIGATLGNVVARVLDVPLDVTVALAMVATFGAASNAPLSLSVMAFELFGGGVFSHALIVCVLARVLSGRRSIYTPRRT